MSTPTTYFATRLGGGGVFETSEERSEFLKRVQGSPVGNTKNFATRDEAEAYAKSEMVAQWSTKEERRKQQELQAHADHLQSQVESLEELNASQKVRLSTLQIALKLQREKTSNADILNRALTLQNKALQERNAAELVANEASRQRNQLLEEQLEGGVHRAESLAAWLRASLDILQCHTDSPEMQVAGHLCQQGKADLAASDIVSELPEPVLIHKKANLTRFAVVACVFTLLFQVMAITAHAKGFQMPNPFATPSAASSMDLCVSGTSGQCSSEGVVAPSLHDFTVLASLVASPFCGMMVAALFI